MKKVIILIWILWFCGACACYEDSSDTDKNNPSLAADPRCDKFYDETFKFCKNLGVWFEDERCKKEWDEAINKCREVTGTEPGPQDVISERPPFFIRVFGNIICRDKKIKKVKK